MRTTRSRLPSSARSVASRPERGEPGRVAPGVHVEVGADLAGDHRAVGADRAVAGGEDQVAAASRR